MRAILIRGTLLNSCLAATQQLSDFIWQLCDVDAYRPTGNPKTGYQNLTWCCIKAVAESLDVENGQLVIRPGHHDWILLDSGDASELVSYSNRSQSPCTATYVEGDNHGAPVVQVPYAWLADVCPGWQPSDKSNLNAWLQALSGFLLPAVVFCLSVPRRRKLAVPRTLFAPELDRTSSYLFVIPGALFAGLIALDWTLILLLTTLLLGVPFTLAFVTAFYTPEIGLSCRSLTFTVYASVEFGQIVLWLWAYAGAPTSGLPKFFCKGGWLSNHGFYEPTAPKSPSRRDSKVGPLRVRTGEWSPSAWSFHLLWSILWYAFAYVLGAIAVLAALGGTLMQLLGVYSADIYTVTVQDWFKPLEDRAMVVVSFNSADRISAALSMSSVTQLG